MEPCYKTFISVGNAKQPFMRLLNGLESLFDVLPQPVLVQCGHTPYRSSTYEVTDFINMDLFANYVNAAQVLILHAGAGSVLHALKANKRPIIVPRKVQFDEHVNDHQVAFAKILHAEGRVIMLEDINELKYAVKKVQDEKISFSLTNSKPRALEILNNLLIQLTIDKTRSK